MVALLVHEGHGERLTCTTSPICEKGSICRSRSAFKLLGRWERIQYRTVQHVTVRWFVYSQNNNAEYSSQSCLCYEDCEQYNTHQHRIILLLSTGCCHSDHNYRPELV
jgi:hypothetical protein